MQAIVLAAGSSSRFEPFTRKNWHKSQMVLRGQPILFWTLDELRNKEVTNILVVVNKDNSLIKGLVEEYKQKFPQISVTCINQPQALGMADALLRCKEYIEDSYLVVNASQVSCGSIVTKLLTSEHQIQLVASETKQQHLYGVVQVVDGRAVRLVEKPSQPLAGGMRVVGMYRLNRDFLDALSTYEHTEYTLELALDDYLQKHPVLVNIIDQHVPSLKYSWHLFEIRDTLFEKVKTHIISPEADVHPTAVIDSNVTIEAGAVIGAFAIISEGSYIGKDAVIGQHCIVRKKSCIETSAQVQRHAEVKNSLFQPGSSMHSGFIGDSIIGADAKIGAGFHHSK